MVAYYINLIASWPGCGSEIKGNRIRYALQYHFLLTRPHPPAPPPPRPAPCALAPRAPVPRRHSEAFLPVGCRSFDDTL
ncbi:unnamed protein product [Colias eurytheme]|nr:unnamed protein product [Colias eurytheme]